MVVSWHSRWTVTIAAAVSLLAAGCTTGGGDPTTRDGDAEPIEAKPPVLNGSGSTDDAESAPVGWTCLDISELDLADLATRESVDEIESVTSRCVGDASATDADDRALARASQFGRADTVEYLLSVGADVSFTGAAELPMLIWAARPLQSDIRSDATLDAGKARVVSLLVDAGADLEARSATEGDQTALLFAARFGFPLTAAALLEAGADVEARDLDGNTSLMAAVSSPDTTIEMVKLLLEAGADKTATFTDGETLAQRAQELGRSDVADLVG
jgi:ankyrin repeat protein